MIVLEKLTLAYSASMKELPDSNSVIPYEVRQ